MTEERFLTAQEAAEMLGWTVYKLMREVRAGNFEGCIGALEPEQVRIPLSSIGAYGKPKTTGEHKNKPTDEPELAHLKAKHNAELAELKAKHLTALKEISDKNDAIRRGLEKEKREWDDFKANEKTEIEAARQAFNTEKDKLKELGEKLAGELVEVEAREKDLADRSTALTIGEEKLKNDKLAAVERISKADEEHKKKREEADRQRQEKHAFEMGNLDEAYYLVVNASPQDMNARTKEAILKPLDALCDSWGLKRAFDNLGRYIRREDRDSFSEVEAKATRDKPALPTDDILPANILWAYSKCLEAYNWLKKEPLFGVPFCQASLNTLKALQELVKSQSDGKWADRDHAEILASREPILTRFDYLHGLFMATAQAYQDDQKHDWTDVFNYLVSLCIQLEKKLGVGVSGGSEPIYGNGAKPGFLARLFSNSE